MNENNLQKNKTQQNNNKSKFKEMSFNELIETLYKDETPENKEIKKQKIEESLKKKRIKISTY